MNTTIQINPTERYAISPYLYMQFMEPLGTADSSVDAAWDFVNGCWHPAVIEKTCELAPTMIRWGGCLASYYKWRETVGPNRIPMLNLCWDGLYANQVGTHEFMNFCRQVKAEPLMTVNMESDGRMHWAHPAPGIDRFGTADEAAEWVRYANDPDDALRKSHGVKDPYGIKYWMIGNETSYDKHGYCCEVAAEATQRFALAMKEADPSIKLIAWGDDGWLPYMDEVAGKQIDLMAFHHHFGSGLPDSPLFGTQYRVDIALTWDHLMNACHSLEEKIAMRRSEAEAVGAKLAMTEGHFAIPGRNRCEVLSSWAAGVAYARCLNVQQRNADILEIGTMADFFGNRWQVNAMMIPTPLRNHKPYLQPVGQVMKLYRHHMGKQAVSFTGGEGLDITASRTGDTLYLHVANTRLTEAVAADLAIDGFNIISGVAHEIAADPEKEITELEPAIFDPVTRVVSGSRWVFPAASVTALVLKIEKQCDE